ncbi:Trehalose-6-phosphate phosphatase [Austwickia sp. TVS 96-490-7B]|uniref:trehalose-phosphatase n=1 Tax=Austwickia sp. TVS 96-490-7B TaxID=2830843 RepID=UPI001DC2CC52|nr:trehalose-phosphatase [Austwickia sp. TVS 96-490-7B]MBW3083831.1 Trehalose-6-phosphate phosphatase [Austwickia sp. TVS 96-490-7B]
MTAPTSDPTADLTHALGRLAQLETVLVASDFDGTLAPFADDPMQVRPLPAATVALREAAAMPGVHVALVSGRELAVLRDLSGLADDPRIVLIGTHGAQSSLDPDSGKLTTEQQELLAVLDAELSEIADAHPGAWVERKPAAVVLHTRTMPETAGLQALAAAAIAASAHPQVHRLAGKNVLELGVLQADKGSALRDCAAHVGAAGTLYLGDDVTDERAFAVLTGAQDVTVKVGTGSTAASWRVDGVEEAVTLLAEFVRVRRAVGAGH